METEIQGLAECMQNLRNLPENIQRNIMRGAVYNGANFVRDHLKEAAPVLQPGTVNPHEREAGQLRDNIKAVMVHAPRGQSIGGIRIRNRSDVRADIKRLSKRGNVGDSEALQANQTAGWWTAVEYGHSSKARPFIRRTWDAIAERTLAYMRDYMASRIIKLTSEWIVK